MKKKSIELKERLGIQCPSCKAILQQDNISQYSCSSCGYSQREKGFDLLSDKHYQSQEEFQDLLDNVNILEFKRTYSASPIKPKKLSEQRIPLNIEIELQSILAQQSEQNSSCEDSDEECLQQKEKQLKKTILKLNHTLKEQKKVIVGSGFTFDMTDFFKFKKKEIAVRGQVTVFDELSGSRLAWVILLLSICTNAMVPRWITNRAGNKFIKQSWRYLMQAFFIIPLLLYQRRTLPKEHRIKYQLSYIFNPKNFVKPYISSLASSLWFLLILTDFEWTMMSHAIILGGLSNFFLSLNRSLNKKNHNLQAGGQVLVMLGICFVIHDSFTVTQTPDGYKNNYFQERTWWERLCGDFLALGASFMMSNFSRYTSDLKNYFPPFLSMFIVSFWNAMHLTFISYFFNGTQFSFDSFWGVFGLFTNLHFNWFMYIGMILVFGQIISAFLITKMFPDPIIPALTITLEPYLACYFIDLYDIQTLPGNFAMIGFLLILPGMLVILMGQCFLKRQKSVQEESDRRARHLLDQISQLKTTIRQRQNKTQRRNERALSTLSMSAYNAL